MKIIFITAPFKINTGASERVAYQLIKRLIRRNYEVIVVQPGWSRKRCFLNNIEVWEYPSTRYYTSPGGYIPQYLSMWQHLPKILNEVTRENKVDLIVSTRFFNVLNIKSGSGFPPLLIYELNHYPWQDDPEFNLLPLARRITAKLDRKFLLTIAEVVFEKSSAVITVSNTIKNWILDNVRLPPSKIKVVYNGVDVEKFKPDPNAENLRKTFSPKGERLLLHVGTDWVVVRKGLHYAVKVMQYLPRNVKLVVVGYRYTPPENLKYIAWIKNMIEKYNLTERIIFRGWVSNEELPLHFSSCDIYLFPSILEGFGLSIIEALASGKPVVGFDIPPINELVENGKEGILVPLGDVKRLAHAIQTIFEDKSLLIKMSLNARRKAEEKFSWDKIVDEHIKLYSSIVYNYR